jgi:hypothetical protein
MGWVKPSGKKSSAVTNPEQGCSVTRFLMLFGTPEAEALTGADKLSK